MQAGRKPGAGVGDELLILEARGSREHKCMLIVSNLRPTSAATLGGVGGREREGGREAEVRECP